MKTHPLPPPAPRPRRGHGRATLADVAAHAGVTAITVSRWLREPGRVAAATAERVRAALAATGYLPNKQAGGLASGRSAPIVAALIPNLANSVFAETVQGLADVLQAAGYELMLAPTNYSLEREAEQLRTLLGWGPAALVVTGRHHTPAAAALLGRAAERGTPVVEVWDHRGARAPAAFAQIGFDHAAVGRLMARHLLGRGWRSLAYVDSAVAEDLRAHERRRGFVAEARRAGASVRVVDAAPGDAYDAGRQALAALVAAEPPLQAAAFANDTLACGALLEAQARGLAVPARLAVLGFGDFALGRQLAPTLSTVRPPRREIGTAAGQALVQALAGGVAPAGLALPCALIERASTAAAPR